MAGQEKGDEGISTRKAIIYIAVVIGCFGTLYPRIIHPMFKQMFGITTEKEKEADQPYYPPQMKGQGGPLPHQRGTGMRPPPGAHADAHGQQKTEGGGSGGVMTMILPVYAVGIVLYLLYTASKVYGGGGEEEKKKKKRRGPGGSTDELYELITERLAGIDLEKVLAGEDAEGAEEINQLADYLRQRNRDGGYSDVTGPKPSKPQSTKHKKEEKKEESEESIEELLKKCEKSQPMTEEEIKKMQSRLLEVESRMSKLMANLNTVQEKTVSLAETLVSESVEEEGQQPQVSTPDAQTDEDEETDDDDDNEDDQLSLGTESSEGSAVELIYADQTDSEAEEHKEAAGDAESGGLRRRHVGQDSELSDEESNE